MRPLIALHETTPKHLAIVKIAMGTLGAPTIRAVEVGDMLFAIEGTHRLAAAKELGILPVGEVVEDDIITGLDIDDQDTWQLDELRDHVAQWPLDATRAIYTKYMEL